MTISSSLNAGVTGLNVNASRLATIADNIANSSTYGYRRAVVDFSSLVLTDTPGTYTAGGVRANSSREVDTRGSLVSTSNATDLAVSGRGMFAVTQITDVRAGTAELPISLLPTGSFRTDEEGYLRNSGGLVLLGWAADGDGTIPNHPRDGTSGLEPVRIFRNQALADPTTRVSLGVNVPAAAAVEAAAAGAAGDTLTVPVVYYDNVGAKQTLTANFTPTGTASNAWSLVFEDSASTPAAIAEFTLTFDETRGAGGAIASVTPVSGGTYDGTTGDLSLTVDGGPLTVSIGTVGGSEFVTQLSSSFAPTGITTNGAPVGTLARIDVDENGFLTATYDTGFNRTLYQIPLADVTNPNGLAADSNQSYTLTNSSGPLYLWDAGQGPTGGVIGFALEESTADLAGELTQLIQTQRAYSSNAKVIQTVDEMLQETTNIIR